MYSITYVYVPKHALHNKSNYTGNTVFVCIVGRKTNVRLPRTAVLAGRTTGRRRGLDGRITGGRTGGKKKTKNKSIIRFLFRRKLYACIFQDNDLRHAARLLVLCIIALCSTHAPRSSSLNNRRARACACIRYSNRRMRCWP